MIKRERLNRAQGKQAMQTLLRQNRIATSVVGPSTDKPPKGRHAFPTIWPTLALVLGAALIAIGGHPLPHEAIYAQEVQASGMLGEVAPLLDEQTIAVMRIDVSKLNPLAISEFAKPLVESIQVPPEQSQEVLALFQRLHRAWSEAGGGELFVALDLTQASRSPATVFAVVRKEGNAEAISRLLAELQFETRETMGNVVVAGSKSAVARAKQNRAVPHVDLRAALSEVGDSPIQIAAHLPSDARRVAVEFGPTIPAEFGIGKKEELVGSFRWLAIGVDTPPNLGLRIVLQADGAVGAKRLQQALNAGLTFASNQKAVREMLPNANALARQLQPQLNDSRLEVKLTGEEAASWLRASVAGPLAAARRSVMRTRSLSNLRQIAFAMHNYHDKNRKFPPAASRGPDGKALLSWRVHLLPFLDQEALYAKFKLDEPWDSPHNKTLIAAIPPVFVAPNHERLAREGKTVYVVPVGDKSVFGGPEGISIVKIADGTSNTLMSIQVPESRAVVWTQPADWEYTEPVVIDQLVVKGEPGFLAAFCDGSARFITRAITPETLLHLLQASDGNPIDPF
jgi:hypothetical protein